MSGLFLTKIPFKILCKSPVYILNLNQDVIFICPSYQQYVPSTISMLIFIYYGYHANQVEKLSFMGHSKPISAKKQFQMLYQAQIYIFYIYQGVFFTGLWYKYFESSIISWVGLIYIGHHGNKLNMIVIFKLFHP